MNAASPQLAKIGKGKGIVMLVDAKNLDEVAAKAKLKYVSTLAAKFSWAQFEPARDVFDFTPLRNFIASRRNKTISIHLGACGIAGGTNATPAWFFSAPEAAEEQVAGPRPLLWGKFFVSRIKLLLAKLGEYLGANRAVEIVRVTGLVSDGSGEPGGYNELNASLSQAFAKAGILMSASGRKPIFNGTDAYSLAVLDVLNAAVASLPNHRIEVVFHFPGIDATTVGLDNAMVDFACSHGCLLANPGLNDGDKSNSRQQLVNYRERGAQVGWASMTHITANDPTAWPRMCNQEAVGDADHQPIAPISYVLTNANTSPDHDAELAALSEKLVR